MDIAVDRCWLQGKPAETACRCASSMTPLLSMAWFEPLAGITSDGQRGAVELRIRPRALAVRWGHERLVGCRAFEPCH